MKQGCINHPGLYAVNTCDWCRAPFCKRCLAHHGDELICRTCLSDDEPAEDAPRTEAEVWRNGGVLVMRRKVSLPRRCLKCGSETDVSPFERKLSWHPPAYYLFILAGLVWYIIIALIVRKTARVALPVCSRHRAQRRLMVGLVWLLFLLGMAVMIGGGVLIVILVPGINHMRAFYISFFTGTVIIFIGLLMAVSRLVTLVTPKLIDDRFVHLAGACDEYLSPLPNWRHDRKGSRRP